MAGRYPGTNKPVCGGDRGPAVDSRRSRTCHARITLPCDHRSWIPDPFAHQSSHEGCDSNWQRHSAGSQLRTESGALSLSRDRKSTRLNSSHGYISYAVFCLKKKNSVSIATSVSVLDSTVRLP